VKGGDLALKYGDLTKFDDFGYCAGRSRLNIATTANVGVLAGGPPCAECASGDDQNLVTNTLKWDHPSRQRRFVIGCLARDDRK